MKQTSARSILILVDALLLLAALCVAPFAWILRDGLGPESVQSTGFAALGKAFMTFYTGPAILLLAGLRFLLRYITKPAEGRGTDSKPSFYWLWMILLLVFLTLLASGLFFD